MAEGALSDKEEKKALKVFKKGFLVGISPT